MLRRCVTDLIVRHEMNASADGIIRQMAQLKRFRDNTLDEREQVNMAVHDGRVPVRRTRHRRALECRRLCRRVAGRSLRRRNDPR